MTTTCSIEASDAGLGGGADEDEQPTIPTIAASAAMQREAVIAALRKPFGSMLAQPRVEAQAPAIHLRVTLARTVPARSCRATSSTRSPALPRTTHSTLSRSSVTW